jgi:hypothetical protein
MPGIYAGAMAEATTTELDKELRVVRKSLREASVPDKLLRAIETRALRTGRKLTGDFQTNRQPRWQIPANWPQYGTEVDCKLILLRLFATLLEFDGAPSVGAAARHILEKRLGRPLVQNGFRDELLLEKVSYDEVVGEAQESTHGLSMIHIGHRDPTLKPKHKPNNVEWRTHRSNLIQGNMTLPEARMYLVKLIARYFELGEVTIVQEP